MSRVTSKDHERFRQILKRKIRKNLHRYITNHELIGKKGKDFVSIPIPQIDTPDFRYDSGKQSGVGQGEGDEGTPLYSDGSNERTSAGNLPGEHILEVNVSLEELAEALGEELELPKIKNKGKKNIESDSYRYTSISTVGPGSLRHFKRSYIESIKHTVTPDGEYDLEETISMIPVRGIERIKTSTKITTPQSNAVIFYMMDVSGSMDDEQKYIARIESFWINTWLKSNYKGLEVRFIIHDVDAKEVNQEKFFTTREGGGTNISSAYRLCHKIINTQFNPEDWNIYCFHFSDGDNWSEDDDKCYEVLAGVGSESKSGTGLLDKVNLFGYAQINSVYGKGRFIDFVIGLKRNFDNILSSQINNRIEIKDSIKEFLGKGK